MQFTANKNADKPPSLTYLSPIKTNTTLNSFSCWWIVSENKKVVLVPICAPPLSLSPSLPSYPVNHLWYNFFLASESQIRIYTCIRSIPVLIPDILPSNKCIIIHIQSRNGIWASEHLNLLRKSHQDSMYKFSYNNMGGFRFKNLLLLLCDEQLVDTTKFTRFEVW